VPAVAPDALRRWGRASLSLWRVRGIRPQQRNDGGAAAKDRAEQNPVAVGVEGARLPGGGAAGFLQAGAGAEEVPAVDHMVVLEPAAPLMQGDRPRIGPGGDRLSGQGAEQAGGVFLAAVVPDAGAAALADLGAEAGAPGAGSFEAQQGMAELLPVGDGQEPCAGRAPAGEESVEGLSEAGRERLDDLRPAVREADRAERALAAQALVVERLPLLDPVRGKPRPSGRGRIARAA